MNGTRDSGGNHTELALTNADVSVARCDGHLAPCSDSEGGGGSGHADRPTQAKCWIYRAEGHTSLVVANLKEGIVYRMPKRIAKDQERSKVKYEEMRHKLQRGIDFVKYVMTPLIGHHLVTAGSLVELEKGFADHINAQVSELRPGYRKFQEVDSDCPFTVRLPDHCLIHLPQETVPNNPMPTYSIEIKSKCGFLPDASHIHEDSCVKLAVCRFCLHQYIKVESGKWDQRSLYCPVNLYSGNYKRMANALHSVFKTPQNNVRIFKDGAFIFGDDVQNINISEYDFPRHFPIPSENMDIESNRDLNGFIDMVIRCLLYMPPVTEEVTYTYPEQFCIRGWPHHNQSPPGAGLPRGCALGRVLYAQRLDSLDIERIYPLYKRVQNHLRHNPEDRKNWNLDGPFSAPCWYPNSLCQDTEDDGSVEFAVKKVREFLISRTAKDCSLMVTLQPLTPEESEQVPEQNRQAFCQYITSPSGKTYRFSVAVIDLDPKPWDKIAHYFKEDSSIIEYHKQYSNDDYVGCFQ